jgi:DNA-binding NarL/FixJ family response regulator
MGGDRRIVDAMLAAGAVGFLLKDAAAEELVAALRIVAAGGRYTSRGLGGPPAADAV